MKELLFDLTSYFNATGWALSPLDFAPAIFFSIAGLMLALYLHKKKTLNSDTVIAIGCSVFFVGAIGSMIGASVVSSATQDPKLYKVGMCFREDRDYQSEIVYHQKRITDEVQEVLEYQSAYALAVKVNANNQADLLDRISRSEKYLAELKAEPAPLKVYNFVVLENKDNVQLTYQKEKRLVLTAFALSSSRYQVECSADLKKVVQVYQATGKIIALNN